MPAYIDPERTPGLYYTFRDLQQQADARQQRRLQDVAYYANQYGALQSNELQRAEQERLRAEADAQRQQSLESQLISQQSQDAQSMFNLQRSIAQQVVSNEMLKNNLRRQSLNDQIAVSRLNNDRLRLNESFDPFFGPALVRGAL